MEKSESSKKETLPKELESITKIVEALKSLDDDSKFRVLDYVFSHLNIRYKLGKSTVTDDIESISSTESKKISSDFKMIDIRSLKEEKKPSTDREMAAIVGYYLSELAPIDERKESINQEDIVKYFKQADFKLPKHSRMTLPQAKEAGYFDTLARGQYKLNPVGYNLVVHNLPKQKTLKLSLGTKFRKNKPKKNTQKKKK